MKTIHDVCVIGTGAGGGVWIDALTRAGLHVVALERGPHLGPKDFLEHTELTNITRGSAFAPDWRETNRTRASEAAEPGRKTMLAQCVGGGTVHWGAWAWRYREDDFRVLSSEGPLAGASLADWPVSYAELAPWYDAAERRLGLAGTAGSNPFEPARTAAYPNPPHPPRAATRMLEAGAKQLGLHPFPTPLAINPRPFDGRSACLNGGMCSNFGCPVHAKASTYAIHLRDALATGRLDLRADTRVVELTTGKDGRVRAAHTLDGSGREGEVRARHFVLAAGGIGSPHLLLGSRSARHPEGLANGSGLVGRNLMFHRLTFAFMELPERSYGALGTNGMVSIDDWHPSDAKRGFIRGAVVGEAAEPSPIWASVKAAGWIGGGKRAWGRDLKAYLRRYPYLATLVAIGEDLPRHENRVDLDPTHRDSAGIAVPRITYESHANDDALSAFYSERMHELAAASGAIRSWSFDSSHARGGSGHIMGACRMGSDPQSSVVDGWCRSHEVPNLYVSDGSCFPTSGGYNPTLTIFALAARAADRFVRAEKRADLA